MQTIQLDNSIYEMSTAQNDRLFSALGCVWDRERRVGCVYEITVMNSHWIIQGKALRENFLNLKNKLTIIRNMELVMRSSGQIFITEHKVTESIFLRYNTETFALQQKSPPAWNQICIMNEC